MGAPWIAAKGGIMNKIPENTGDDGVLTDNDLESVDLREFGRLFLQEYLKTGFGSLVKKDVDLLVFSILHDLGAFGLEREMENYAIARGLKITGARLKTLQRESHARWQLRSPEKLLERTLEQLKDPKQLENSMNYMAQNKKNLGRIPVIIENSAEKAEFLHAIKQEKGIAKFERNQEVILVNVGVLFAISNRIKQGTSVIDDDTAKRIQKRLRKESAKNETLTSLLMKDPNDWTSQSVRVALNRLAAETIEEGLKDGVGSAAKLVALLFVVLL